MAAPGRGSGSSRRAATMTARPTGTLTKKTARQPWSSPKSAISAPPSSGPAAVERPTVVPK